MIRIIKKFNIQFFVKYVFYVSNITNYISGHVLIILIILMYRCLTRVVMKCSKLEQIIKYKGKYDISQKGNKLPRIENLSS